VRMAGRDVSDLAVIGVLHRLPGVALGMFRVRMMRAWEIRKGRPILAGRRRVIFTLRARLIRVVMRGRVESVARSIMMFLAFVVREIVLRFFSD
jgi:hypothetical protein